MSSFHMLALKVLGLPALLGAVSLSQDRARRTQGDGEPSVSLVADVDDHDYGMGSHSFKAGTPGDAVYNHMPKAGGTFLIRLLRSALGGFRHFRVEPEFASLTQDDINNKFVMGSVRNPCDYYLSLWSYGAEHGGSMMSSVPKEQRWVYDTKSPDKDSLDDINRFHAWVRTINLEGHPGVMSVRFAQSYAKLDREIRAIPPPLALEPEELDAVARALSKPTFMDRVNCWIKADDMKVSSRDCLLKWHNKTGLKVDWDAFQTAYKETDRFSSTHGDCKAYFTPELEKYVRRREAPIFEYFGYGTCCA